MRLPRSLAFVFVAAGVAIACSSSDSATSGSSGGTNTSSGGSKTADGGGTVAVPCGGAGQKACGGTGCTQASDCASSVCDATTGKCTDAAPVPPSATDGKKDGTETDVDCGGPDAPKCDDTKNCGAAGDCTSGVCNVTCQAPSSGDTIQNGDETDVDCGGTTTKAKPCATGLKCKVHADCASDGCDDTLHCALGRSCTQTNGGLTCGQGEVEDANHKFDSCCTALPVPGMNNVLLDKYEVTAGRMRAFITRVNGDVKTWYTTNKGTLSAAAVAQIDAYVDDLPTSIDGDGNDVSSAKLQLGADIFLTDRPSVEQGCYVGKKSDPGYGSHTYWDGADEGEDRAFDQAFLDRLALNCVAYPLMAAFCAWDGGRLQTYEENDAAYGSGKYPWGNAPEAGGFNNYPAPDGDYQELGPGAFNTGTTSPAATPCPSCDATMMNWDNAYQHPDGDSGKPWDLANYISPPGRFPKDVGAGGHMDLGGNMLELTASPGANDAKYGAAIRWTRSGSWEGHQANYAGWDFPIMTKYGKTGGRCAHDM